MNQNRGVLIGTAVFAFIACFSILLYYVLQAVEDVDISALKFQQKIAEIQRETAKINLQAAMQQIILQSSYVRGAAEARAIFWYSLPMLLFSGGAIYLLRRPYPFEFEGVKTFLPRNRVEAVTLRAIAVKELSEQEKVAMLREDLGAKHLMQGVSLVGALRQAWKGANGQLQEALPATAEQPIDAHAVEIPSYRQVLQGILTNNDGALYFGTDREAGVAVRMTLEQSKSLFIAGGTGTGKSSFLSGLISQLLLISQEALIMLLDPNRGKRDSLTNRIPKTERIVLLDPKDPYDALNKLRGVLEDRLDQGGECSPILLIAEEYPALMGEKYAGALTGLVERITREGRGVGIFAVATTQDSRLKKNGDLRDTVPSAIAFRMKPKLAQHILQNKADLDHYKEGVENLPEQESKGVAMLHLDGDESRIVKIPYFSPDDRDFVSEKLSYLANRQTTVERTADDVAALKTAAQPKIDPSDASEMKALLAEYGQGNAATLSKRLGISESLIRMIRTGQRPITTETRTRINALRQQSVNMQDVAEEHAAPEQHKVIQFRKREIA